MLRSTFLPKLSVSSVAGRSSIIVMGTMTIMVAVLVWVVSASLSTIRAAGDQFQHSAAVELAAGDVLTAAVNQQAGIRGYAESGDANFLAPYTRGEVEYRSAHAALVLLTQDNPEQAARVRDVDTAMRRWRQVYAQPQLTGDPAARAAPERVQGGKFAMDQVRRVVGDIRGEEARRGRERYAARDRAYSSAYLTLYAVGGLVLALGLGLGIWALALVARGEREARAHAEAKTQLLAVVSHDIRTPLNGMLGMLRAMNAEPLPGD